MKYVIDLNMSTGNLAHTLSPKSVSLTFHFFIFEVVILSLCQMTACHIAEPVMKGHSGKVPPTFIYQSSCPSSVSSPSPHQPDSLCTYLFYKCVQSSLVPSFKWSCYTSRHILMKKGPFTSEVNQDHRRHHV